MSENWYTKKLVATMAVSKQPGLSASEKAVLKAHCEMADMHWRTSLSREDLESLTSLSSATVSRANTSLTQMGYLTTLRRGAKGKRPTLRQVNVTSLQIGDDTYLGGNRVEPGSKVGPDGSFKIPLARVQGVLSFVSADVAFCPGSCDDQEGHLLVAESTFGDDVRLQCTGGCDWREIRDLVRTAVLDPQPRRLTPRYTALTKKHFIKWATPEEPSRNEFSQLAIISREKDRE